MLNTLLLSEVTGKEDLNVKENRQSEVLGPVASFFNG